MFEGHKTIGIVGSDSGQIEAILKNITELTKDAGASANEHHLDGHYYAREVRQGSAYDIFEGTKTLRGLGADFAVILSTDVPALVGEELIPNLLPVILLSPKTSNESIAEAAFCYSTGRDGQPDIHPRKTISPKAFGKQPSSPKVGIAGGWAPIAGAVAFREVASRGASPLLSSVPSIAGEIAAHIHNALDANPKFSIAQPDWKNLYGLKTNPLDKFIAIHERLAAAGCDSTFTACNTIHAYFEELQKSLSRTHPAVKPVHILRDSIRSLPPHSHIGVLGTTMTIEGNLVESAIKASGRKDVHFVRPGTPEQETLNNTIWQQIHAGNIREAVPLLQGVIGNLGDADDPFMPIMYSCTDLAACMEGHDASLSIIDTMKLGAAHAAEIAIKSHQSGKGARFAL